LLNLISKWNKNLTDEEPDFNPNPNVNDTSDDNFVEDFGGISDGDLLNEDASNSFHNTAGSITKSPVPRKSNRKGTKIIPSFSRELNLRRRERKNYNVGSPSKKCRKLKSVNISCVLLLQNVLVIRSN